MEYCPNVNKTCCLDVPVASAVQAKVDLMNRAKALFNSVFNTVQFWDERAKDLNQAVSVMTVRAANTKAGFDDLSTCGDGRWSNVRHFVGLLIMLTILSVLAINTPVFADSGESIAINGGGVGATACTVCHGPAGMGNPTTGFPRLAGLNAEYLARQLRDYQSGSRSNSIMQPIASALDETQKLAVSEYYAAQDVSPAPSIGRADRAPRSLGERLAMRGAWDRDIPECVSCHGPGGGGVGAVFPRLAGQHASYIEQQLKAWKQGSRTNDPNQLMLSVAQKLTDEESAAVADYFAQLGVPDASK